MSHEFYLSVLKEIQKNIRNGIEAPICKDTASSKALDFAIHQLQERRSDSFTIRGRCASIARHVAKRYESMPHLNTRNRAGDVGREIAERLDKATLDRIQNSPGLFGSGIGFATHTDFTCDLCRVRYNEGSDESGDYDNDGVINADFAGLCICEDCFAKVEIEIWRRRDDVMEWIAKAKADLP